MPTWYWEKNELRSTPSIEKGMDYSVETRYRREGVRFIMELGKALNLRHDTMASAAVYYHRFYMFHTFHEFPKFVVATCCLFLAGKAEETPKKCRDLIRTVRQLTNDRQFATFGNDPKEEIMIIERVLLQTIKFDLQVDHPYTSLLKYAKCLKGDNAKLQKMVQMSWTFVNDSLCTPLCLQWEPEIIAIALMYLAAKLSKFEVREWASRQSWHKHWWDQYVEDLDVDILEDICHQVLDLYSPQTMPTRETADSPPPPQTPSRSSQTSSQPPAPLPPSSTVPRHATPPPPKTQPQTPPPKPPPPPPVAAPPSATIPIPPTVANTIKSTSMPQTPPFPPSSYPPPRVPYPAPPPPGCPPPPPLPASVPGYGTAPPPPVAPYYQPPPANYPPGYNYPPPPSGPIPPPPPPPPPGQPPSFYQTPPPYHRGPPGSGHHRY